MNEIIQEQNENTRDIIFKNITDIRALCVKHFVKNLFVFGSILTEYFDKQSDVDFLYEIDVNKLNKAEGKTDYVDNLFQFEDALSAILKRKIDLLPNIYIHNKYMRENINRNKRLLYAA